MVRSTFHLLLGAGMVLLGGRACSLDAKAPASAFRLDSLKGLEIVNVKAEAVNYRGRPAVRMLQSIDDATTGNPEKTSMVVLTGTDFKDGTIEVEIAGAPRAGAPADARGFMGIAFRMQPGGSQYECFYLRATNGRAEDQLRRNHSTQYISYPDYPWERLRKENPGQYESYADMETGAWNKVKIVVAGTKAKLYVNGAEQPTLIVNDLKLGESHGQIALWIAVDTDAYFSNLTVK
jgi:hypothetical protein